MRSVLPLLLFPLLAGASKPERVDRHLQVGPLVASVVSGSKTLGPEGDFFRAVLANSEYDACLRVERVNVRVPNAPRIEESRRYCAVTLGKARLSLAADDPQEAELSNLSWKEFELSFDLSYVAAGRAPAARSSAAPSTPGRPGARFSAPRDNGKQVPQFLTCAIGQC